MTDDELGEWCASHRAKVVEYLGRQAGLQHGAIGEWPAWRLTPHVSVWAVESVRSPGAIGWWVICGDLPMDYCTGGSNCRIPRLAVAEIVQRWRSALEQFNDGEPTI